MGSRGSLKRSSFRRGPGCLDARTGKAGQARSRSASVDQAQLAKVGDTSDAQIVRIDLCASLTDRQVAVERPRDPVEVEGFYLVAIDLGGRNESAAERRSETAAPAADRLVDGEGSEAEARWIFLRVKRRALDSRLQALTQVPVVAPLVFEPNLMRSSEGRTLVDDRVRRLLKRLKVGGGPEIIAGLEEALTTALLTCCRHNYSLRFDDHAAARLPRHVKLVEDYIVKNAEKPISMKDLEGIAGISARSIHYAFRRFRGYSPKALLQAVRLDRAHRTLLTADPRERVMTIATSCGFAHLGRFSAVYKKRFGELPSQTLGRK